MPQTTTNVGRANIPHPDLGYAAAIDGGVALHAQKRANMTRLSNGLVQYFFFDDATGWDGVATSKTYVVDGTLVGSVGSISDARRAVFFIMDTSSNNFRQMAADITKPSATQVTIEVGIPLPAGTYRIIGVGII
jgi:hypothetical protein